MREEMLNLELETVKEYHVVRYSYKAHITKHAVKEQCYLMAVILQLQLFYLINYSNTFNTDKFRNTKKVHSIEKFRR